MNASRKRKQDSSESPQTNRPAKTGRESISEVVAWCVAGAAMLIALMAWIDRGRATDRPEPIAGDTLSQRADALMTGYDDALRLAVESSDARWQTEEWENGANHLIWSDEAQSGFLSVRGLTPNDADSQTYQIWIYDASRDLRYPVDGGLFSIRDAAADSLIEIKPVLKISKAMRFEVTLESSHGTVVSDRSNRVLVANMDGS